MAFAESVVRANAITVDFSNFEDLLARIEEVLKHYSSRFAAATAPSATALDVA